MNLQDLIAERKAGRSYEQLSRDCGGAPTAARLQQIATTPLRSFPDPDTIRSLATGLRVPQRAVLTASAESLGLDVAAGASRLEDWLPSDRLDELTPEQVDAVLALITAMLAPPAAETRRVEGGVLLFVERMGSTETNGYDAGLARDLLESVYPVPAGELEEAILYLSRRMAPAMGELRLHLMGKSGARSAPEDYMLAAMDRDDSEEIEAQQNEP